MYINTYARAAGKHSYTLRELFLCKIYSPSSTRLTTRTQLTICLLDKRGRQKSAALRDASRATNAAVSRPVLTAPRTTSPSSSRRQWGPC